MIYKLFFIYIGDIYVTKNYIYTTQNWLGICNKTTHIYKLAVIQKNNTEKSNEICKFAHQ